MHVPALSRHLLCIFLSGPSGAFAVALCLACSRCCRRVAYVHGVSTACRVVSRTSKDKSSDFRASVESVLSLIPHEHILPPLETTEGYTLESMLTLMAGSDRKRSCRDVQINSRREKRREKEADHKHTIEIIGNTVGPS
jgi:hypothetical protein